MAGPQTYNINKRIASLNAGLLKVDELMKNHAQLQTDYEDLNNKYLLLVEREGKTRKLVAKCTQLMKENAEMKQQLQSSDALSEELEKWKLEHEKVSQCLEMYKQQVNVMHMEENCKFNRTDLIKLCHELFQCRNKTKQVACLWKTFYKKYREELIYHRLPILKIQKCKMKKMKKEEPFEEDDLTTDLTQLHSVESGYHESDSVVESTGSLTSKCDSKLDQNLDEQDLVAIYDANEDMGKAGWMDNGDSRDSLMNDLENNLSKDDTDFVSLQNRVEPLVNIPNGLDGEGLSNNLPVDLSAKELPDISNGLLVNISENLSKSTEFFKDCVVSEINNSPAVEHLFSPGRSVSSPTVEQIGELFETCKINEEKSEVETGQNQHLDCLHFSNQKDYPLEVQSFVHVPEVNSEKEFGQKQVQSELSADSETEDSDDLDDLGKQVEEQIVNHRELRNQEVEGAEDTVDLQELVSMYQVPAPVSPIPSPQKRRRKKKNLQKDQKNSATRFLCGVGSIFSPPASRKSLDRNKDECNLGALVSDNKKNEEKSGKELEFSEKTCRTLAEHIHESQSELNFQSTKKEIVENSRDVSENVSSPKINNIEGQKEKEINLESSGNILSNNVENFPSSDSSKINNGGKQENEINLESSANIPSNDVENFTSSSSLKINDEGQKENEINLGPSAYVLSNNAENFTSASSPKINDEGQKENEINLGASANIFSNDVENFTSSSSLKINYEGQKENEINLGASANIFSNDVENFTSSSSLKINDEGQKENEILESSAIILSKYVENSEDRISKKLKRKYKNKDRDRDRDIKRKKKMKVGEELLKKLTKLTEKLEKEKKCSKKRNNHSILLRGNRLKGYSSNKQRAQFSWDVEDLQEEMVDDVNNKETITVENNLEEKQNEHLTNLEMCKNLIETEQSEMSEHSGKNSLEIIQEQYKIFTESGDEELAKNCAEDLRKIILLGGKEPCNTFERPLEEVPIISQEEENFEADKSGNMDDFAQILQNDSLEDLGKSSLLFDGEEPFKNFDQLMEEEAAENRDEKNCKEDKGDELDLAKPVQEECSQYAQAVPYRADMRLGNQEQSINMTGPGFSPDPDGLVIEKNFPPEIQSPDRKELPDNSTRCIEYFSGNESDGEPSGKSVIDAQKNLVSKKCLDLNDPKTTVEESAINQGKNFSVNDVGDRTVLAEALRLLRQQLFPIASDINSSSGDAKNLEQPILTSDPLTKRVLSEAVDVNSLPHVKRTLGKDIKRPKTSIGSIEICPAKNLKQKISEKLPNDVDKKLCSISGSYSTPRIQKTMNKTLSENVRKNAGFCTGLVAVNNPPSGVKIPGQKTLSNGSKNCKDHFSRSESDGESPGKLVIHSQEDLASEKSLDVNVSVISSHTYQLRSKRLPLDDKSNKVVSSGTILKKLRGRPRKISPPKKASKPPDIAEPQPENKKIVPRKTVPDESSCKNDSKVCDNTSSPQKYSADYSPVAKRPSRGVKTPVKRRRIKEDSESYTDQEEPFRKNLTLLIDEREKREVRKINKKPPENNSVSGNGNLPVPDGNLNTSVLKPIVSPVISPDANSDPTVQFSGKQPRKRVARDKSESVKSGEMCADCLGPCVGTCKKKLIVTEDTHKMSLRSVKGSSTLKSVPASGTLSSHPKNLDVDTGSSPKVTAEVGSREEETKSAGNCLLDSILTKMTKQQKVFKCDTPRRVATVLPVFIPEEGKSHFHETSIVPSLPGDKAKKGLSPSVFTNIGDIEIKELGGSAKEEGSAPPTLRRGQKCAKKVRKILVDYVETDVKTPEESNKAIKNTLYSLLDVHEEVIASVTVQLLIENVDEDININEPPHPPMTKTQTKLFVLFCLFQQKSENHKNIKNVTRQIIREKLFPENFVWPDDSILSCARFYTALCKHDNDLSGIWKFFFSALIEMPKRFPLVIFTILVVWPDILHDANIMKKNIVDSKMAAVQLILSTAKTEEQRNKRQIHKLFVVRDLLVKFYNYDWNSNFEEYLKHVLEEFCKENKSSKKCLSLIIRVKKWDWTEKKIIPGLLEFVKFWADKKVSDWIGTTSLELLRVASEKVPKNIVANDIRDCLVNILESKEMSHEKEEMIVDTLISFKDSTNIDEILNSWIPKKAITPSLEKKIIWAKTAKKKGPLNSNETFPGGKPKENIPKTYNKRNITPNNNSNMNKKKKKKKNKKKNKQKAGNNVNSENTNVDATPGSD